MTMQGCMAPKGFHVWLESELVSLGLMNSKLSIRLSPLGGDAGFRQYYRIAESEGVLAVYAPVDTEDSKQFCLIAKYLRENGIRAPRVFAQDYSQGFMLIEDFGRQMLLPALDHNSVDGYYGEALNVLLRLQQSPLDGSVFPPYDAAVLLTEMRVCLEWFIDALLGIKLNAAEHAIFEDAFEQINQCCLAQEQVVVHRDFHSRNIVLTGCGNLGIIDFQDGLIGPLCYDLVSLLKDCYIRWPRQKVETWALAYAAMLNNVGVRVHNDPQVFLRDFDLMGLQRHLKVLGVFARLNLRDNKGVYLRDLPRVLGYIDEVLDLYPEFSALRELFDQRLYPNIKSQPWFCVSSECSPS
ncbi:MAG: aminoglycoside/choline kinase family phosphotransferase [Flavobacteriales bacterium]|jgi:aminoglycoside/choline kinase family phosphotransferase